MVKINHKEIIYNANKYDTGWNKHKPIIVSTASRGIRDEIHRVSPSTRISLCVETREMWGLFGHKLGMSPKNFVCNCGPTSVPGNPLLSPVGL